MEVSVGGLGEVERSELKFSVGGRERHMCRERGRVEPENN